VGIERKTGSQGPTTGQQSAPRETPGGGLGAVRIWLLDGFRISVGSSRSIGEDEWRLKKAGSLLKLLALIPAHRLHREQAMDLLWPELDSGAAANNLHHALHIARRTLEPSAPAGAASGYLHLRGESLALSPAAPVWVDVEAFEEAATTARHALDPAAYRAAIDLYSGELLPQDRYEAWAEDRRAQLRGVYLSLLSEVAGLYEERNEFGKAIEALGRVVAEDPTHEGAQVGLIKMYALLGRRREALRQYERLRDALFREFGSEPEAATVRLHEEIWAGTFPPAQSPLAAGSPPEELPAAGGRNNLPLARTAFIGRERETLEVKRLLAMTRLLTLTGVGGSGKTRLALKVASDLAGAYPDGAWLVELAPLSEAELVPQAVAKALRVREQPGRPLTETLKDALRARKMLLVVDNCEHLVEAAVGLVDALLDFCPGLRVLATSRETLRAAGEVTWVVPSLTVPDTRQEAYKPQELEAYESVRLFVERARQRDPSFELTLRNRQAVAQVCRRLEGIPLAIELAAGRIGVLSVERIAERLDDSLRLLTAGVRTGLPRHRTLRATLEWSHELLGEPERKLFRRLSVFAGGLTLEAAEAVGAGDGIEQHDVLDLLSKLVDKSLVVAEASPGEEGALRYRMLETIRQYGQDRLEENGEAQGVRERHMEYYLALAEVADAQEAERELNAARPVAWLERMESEHANLRAALNWSLDEDDEPNGGRTAELGLRLAVALWWFWHTREYLTEGRRYLEKAGSGMSNPTTTRLRARALDGAAWLALYQGDHGASKTLIEEALAHYRELQDEEGIASGLTDLGLVAVLGQWDGIPLPAVLEELGDLKPELKNRNTLAYLLMLEGMIAMSRDDVEHSVTLHEQSLDLFREIHNTQGIITCLGHLGLLALIRGDYESAPTLLLESLRLAWELDYKQSIQHCLYTLACVTACRERPVRAARLWGVVESMEEAFGAQLTPIILTLTNYEGHLSRGRSQLGKEEFAVAWAGGKAMSLGRAIEYALSDEEEREPPTLVPEQQPPPDERTETLTRREREVALLVARGLTNRQIASELSVSRNTANNHVARILRKLGLRSRAQIAAWVTERRSPSS
jgi:predicted ATPase/DNA-binding SARP family transcriptional activator/DNA-binding CsgD family transcriptional regulator